LVDGELLAADSAAGTYAICGEMISNAALE
jgi:hypothetical protein